MNTDYVPLRSPSRSTENEGKEYARVPGQVDNLFDHAVAPVTHLVGRFPLRAPHRPDVPILTEFGPDRFRGFACALHGRQARRPGQLIFRIVFKSFSPVYLAGRGK